MEFELIVHEKHLNTGVHEYMVWYTASCATTGNVGNVVVSVHCTIPDYCRAPHPNSGGHSMLGCAVEQIRSGAVAAIQGLSIGLDMRITELRIHPVDYNPHRFREHTRDYLLACFANDRMTNA